MRRRQHTHCTIDGCQAKHLAKGMCSRHYYASRDSKRGNAQARANDPFRGAQASAASSRPAYITRAQRESDAERERRILAEVERSHDEQRAAIRREIGASP